MKPTLELKPIHNSFIDILMAFNKGAPLSNQQVNFLRRYHTKFSNTKIDSICKYYGILNAQESKQQIKRKGLALIDPEAIKTEVYAALINAPSYQINMELRQLQQFKILSMRELYFWHGNYTLARAPFFVGNVSHDEFFQWGNLYGIIKYKEILSKVALNANIQIYFEIKRGQTLTQFANMHKKLALSPNILQPKHQIMVTPMHERLNKQYNCSPLEANVKIQLESERFSHTPA